MEEGEDDHGYVDDNELPGPVVSLNTDQCSLVRQSFKFSLSKDGEFRWDTSMAPTEEGYVLRFAFTCAVHTN